jgi:ferritin
MHLTISEELARQLREELMREAAIARLAKDAHAKSDASFSFLRNLQWELARHVGLFGKLLRKQSVK